MDMVEKDRQAGMKLFNFRPVFFVAVFLCFGIAFGFYHLCKGVSTLWLLLGLPVAAFPFFFCHNKERVLSTAFAVLMLGCSFFLGFLSFSSQISDFSAENNASGNGYAVGYVCDKEYNGAWTGLVLEDVTIGEERINKRLVAYLPNAFCENVSLSDKVLVRGNIRTRKVNADNFSSYIQAIGDDVCYEVWTETGEIVGKRFHLFHAIRNRMEEVISAGMDKTSAAVTKAVLLGETAGIDAELYDNIRKGGIAHIFAVSGLHVGALFGFCLLLFKPLKKLPAMGEWLGIFLILFVYAGVCGFSASVVRASVICLVTYAAKLLRMKADFLESLALAAICILLFTPTALFELGFQLSFAACLGIAFLSKPIGQVCDELICKLRKLFTRKKEITGEDGDTAPLGIAERALRAGVSFLSVTLAAQIFTLPLLLYYFGYVSGWALLLNCLFVPLISSAFSLLLLFVFVACLFPTAFSFVVLYVPKVIWSVLLLIFQTMDFSSFAIVGLRISAAAMIPYLFACVFFTDKWDLRKSLRYILACVCILAFGITMVGLNL